MQDIITTLDDQIASTTAHLDTLRAARALLAGKPAAKPTPRRPKRTPAPAVKPARKPRPVAAPSEADCAAVRSALAELGSAPGNAVAREAGVSPRVAVAALEYLVSQGSVTRTGAKRGTKYTLAQAAE
jgi:hypothetical protein